MIDLIFIQRHSHRIPPNSIPLCLKLKNIKISHVKLSSVVFWNF